MTGTSTTAPKSQEQENETTQLLSCDKNKLNQGKEKDMLGEPTSSSVEDAQENETPRKSIPQMAFIFISIVAIINSLVMILCQILVMINFRDVWLEDVLRVYVIALCLVFVSSELQLEERLPILPAMKHWIVRGFFYTFVAVIGYEGTSSVAQGHIVGLLFKCSAPYDSLNTFT